jgi:hypothetical protein
MFPQDVDTTVDDSSTLRRQPFTIQPYRIQYSTRVVAPARVPDLFVAGQESTRGCVCPTMGGSGGGGGGVTHVPVFSRYAAWFMLAGQEFVNKVVRLAIPYIVPFIAQEQAFTTAQTARLLTGFSLGYVTCQVPAGYISTVLGPKFVQLCNNIGMTVLFLGLPSLARRGSMAVFGAVLGVGVLQGVSRRYLPSPSVLLTAFAFATAAAAAAAAALLMFRAVHDCSPRNVVQLVSRGGLT